VTAPLSADLAHAQVLLAEAERVIRRSAVPAWSEEARRLLASDLHEASRRLANMMKVLGDTPDEGLQHINGPLRRYLGGR
jgi:hypothetical protein